jgi:hypothetical protein
MQKITAGTGTISAPRLLSGYFVNEHLNRISYFLALPTSQMINAITATTMSTPTHIPAENMSPANSQLLNDDTNANSPRLRVSFLIFSI